MGLTPSSGIPASARWVSFPVGYGCGGREKSDARIHAARPHARASSDEQTRTLRATRCNLQADAVGRNHTYKITQWRDPVQRLLFDVSSSKFCRVICSLKWMVIVSTCLYLFSFKYSYMQKIPFCYNT